MVNKVRNMFLHMHKQKIYNSRGMLELIGTSFIADEPSIFGVVNEEYVAREIKWYESESLYVHDIPDTPKIWQTIADDWGMINSNYGWCIYSEENGSQYANVVKTLRARPDSKQAIMIYNRPTMHMEATLNGMKDFICTNAVTYNLSHGKLMATVQMRSNDVIFGYKNDYAWQKHVLDKLCKELDVLSGYIIWQVANLHIYPRHFYILDAHV